jgi:hypothetical protein
VKQDPASLLAEILAAAPGERPSAEAVAWLCDGLRHWIAAPGHNGREGPSLPACLGLPGKARAVRRLLRDRFLREAVRYVGSTLGPWGAAEQLRRSIDTFRRAKWRLWRLRPNAPSDASRIELALWNAFRCSAEMPDSTQALSNILKREPSETREQLGAAPSTMDVEQTSTPRSCYQ